MRPHPTKPNKRAARRLSACIAGLRAAWRALRQPTYPKS